MLRVRPQSRDEEDDEDEYEEAEAEEEESPTEAHDQSSPFRGSPSTGQQAQGILGEFFLWKLYCFEINYLLPVEVSKVNDLSMFNYMYIYSSINTTFLNMLSLIKHSDL